MSDCVPPRALSAGMIVFAIFFSACGGGGGDPVAPPPPPISVSVTPSSANVNAGSTQTFSASVSNATNTSVSWTATGGQISGSGASVTWTAPVVGGSYTVTATSTADNRRSASATVIVASVAISITPATIAVDAGAARSFTATVTNAAEPAVRWTTSGGVITGTGATISWSAPAAAGSYTLTATSVADSSKTVSATITVPPIVVSITPDTATLGAAASRSFTASITGSADSTVIWTATGGTVVSNGRTAIWTAPVSGGVYDVRAASTLNPAASASVRITVTPVTVAIVSNSPQLFRGQDATFTVVVGGTAAANRAVSWSSSCGTGTTNASGYVYVAPVIAGTCSITATSVLDPGTSASASVTVRPEWLVTTTNDTNDGACTFAHCSLREALLVANASLNADEILLGSATVNRALSGSITLTDSLPTLRTPIRIRGPGAPILTIDAAASSVAQRRVLTLTGAANVTVEDVTLRGGRAASGGGVQLDSGATARLARVVVTDNEALSLVGGGILVFGGSALELEDVDVIANRAFGASFPFGSGGGIAVAGGSTLQMLRGLVRDNVANRFFGGGIFGNGSALVLTDVRVEGNEAYDAGGGIALWDSAGTLTMNGGVIRNNRILASAPGGVGGGLIAGASSLLTTVRMTLIMQDVLIENNAARTQGGGIQLVRNVTATLDRITVRGNSLGGIGSSPFRVGGGMYVGSLANVILRQSTVDGNTLSDASGAADGGGGIAALALETSALGSLMIDGSTISNNSSSAAGGGLGVGGAQSVTMTNSTVSGNSAVRGGGVWTERTVAMRNVTVNGNRASSTAGGIGAGTNGTLTLGNTLLARNVVGVIAQNCANVGTGVIATLTHNLSDDAACSTLQHATDRINTASGTDTALADNGGPTRTHRLLAGSAAINAGNTQSCSLNDQRGVARVGVCDIGAVEYVPPSTIRAASARLSSIAILPVLRRGKATRLSRSWFAESGLGPAATGSKP